MPDINDDNKRIKFWNEFIAECPVNVAERYKAMQNRLVQHVRNSGQPFSVGGAAEVIMAIAEREVQG